MSPVVENRASRRVRNRNANRRSQPRARVAVPPADEPGMTQSANLSRSVGPDPRDVSRRHSATHGGALGAYVWPRGRLWRLLASASTQTQRMECQHEVETRVPVRRARGPFSSTLEWPDSRYRTRETPTRRRPIRRVDSSRSAPGDRWLAPDRTSRSSRPIPQVAGRPDGRRHDAGNSHLKSIDGSESSINGVDARQTIYLGRADSFRYGSYV